MLPAWNLILERPSFIFLLERGFKHVTCKLLVMFSVDFRCCLTWSSWRHGVKPASHVKTKISKDSRLTPTLWQSVEFKVTTGLYQGHRCHREVSTLLWRRKTDLISLPMELLMKTLFNYPECTKQHSPDNKTFWATSLINLGFTSKHCVWIAVFCR